MSVASALISNNKKRVGKTLKTSSNEGSLVKLNCFRTGKEEAIGIGDEIEKARNNISLNEITILVRAIFQTREFEERFLKIGLPYRIIEELSFMKEQKLKIVYLI